jgi:hypothetical protein
LIAAVLWLSAPALWATSNLDALREHLERGRHAEAWALAENLEPQHIGDPLFDLLYARAALAVGKTSLAIFALERVRMRKPHDRQEWLLLIRAHQQAGDHARARHELDALEASKPSEAIRREARALRTSLTPDRALPFTLQVGLAYGYDNNVNSAPDAAYVSGICSGGLCSPDFAFPTTPATRQQSDTFLRLSANLNGDIEMGGNFHLFGGTGGYVNTLHDWTEFSTSLMQARAGLAWRGEGRQLSLPVSRRVLSVNHSLYNTNDTAMLEWDQVFLGSQRYMLGGGYGASRSAIHDTDDTRYTSVYTGWGMFWDRFRFDLGLRRTRESVRVEIDDSTPPPDNTYKDREHRAVTLDLHGRLSPRQVLHLTLLHQNTQFDAPGDLFPVAREDRLSMVKLLWEWRVMRNMAWRIETQLFANNSNIDFYTYRRTQVLTGVTYEIH